MRSLAKLALLFCFPLIGSGCSTEVGATNPYDPNTPDHLKAKAALTGVVELDWSGDVTEVLIELRPAGMSTHPETDGSFRIEGITPSVQEIHVSLENYQPQAAVRSFQPGECGEESSDCRPLQIRLQVLRGNVQGNVQLQDRSDHSGVVVSLVPTGSITTDLSDGGGSQGTFSDTGGSYLFGGVPVGSYTVTAKKPEYLGQSEPGVTVQANETSTVRNLVLPPVTGAITVRGGPECNVEGYTSTPEVCLSINASWALEMKLSEDPSLSDADWQSFNVATTFTLTQGDGLKTI